MRFAVRKNETMIKHAKLLSVFLKRKHVHTPFRSKPRPAAICSAREPRKIGTAALARRRRAPARPAGPRQLGMSCQARRKRPGGERGGGGPKMLHSRHA